MATLWVGGARCGGCDGESVVFGPQSGHILLRLEKDDVDFGGKEAAKDHWAAQTDRDAHGGGLHLYQQEEG